MAVAPDGEIRRVKLLSSSALRGVVRDIVAPDRLRVEADWAIHPGVVSGLRFRWLGRDGHEAFVRDHDAVASEIRLDREIAGAASPGTPFELLSDEESPVFATRLLTRTPVGRPLPAAALRLATTLGTNALLERAGTPPVLFVTRGFADLLEIGTQQRPDLFALDIRKPTPLYGAVVEVPERLDADGAVLEPLDLAPVLAQADALVGSGQRVAAIALLHAYRNPAHEIALERRLLERGFTHVSRSSALAPRIKLLVRAETAVVDAYLAPVLESYVSRVEASLSGGRLMLMTSNGGLLDSRSFRPKDGLLSGPAGGVIGCGVAGRLSGAGPMIGFDMGGTSTDVARHGSDPEYDFEHEVGGIRLAAPALAIETVAAGGGSVCWLDGRRLRVGPQSAGASPGPACYGAGGPLTVTDVNLLLGRLDPGRFGIPILPERSRQRFAALCDEVEQASGERPDPAVLLDGLVGIANETMAGAIRKVAARRGYDPAEHVLVAFGGAAAQHACALAELLGMASVLVPADAALLSALGLGHAVVSRFEERQVLEPLERVEPLLPAWFDELEVRARDTVCACGVLREAVEVGRRILHLRFVGQEATVDVDWARGEPVGPEFVRRHAELFGHAPERRAIEVESMRVMAASRPPALLATASVPAPHDAPVVDRRRAWWRGAYLDTPVFSRERLLPGARIAGPALIFEAHSATAVEPGWDARVDARRALVLTRRSVPASRVRAARPEAVQLELFTQRFEALVKEMGQRLERTAVSTNVKERLDFSCALLDAAGALVANAPHIPVHLGALGLCVRRVRETLALEPGDVVVTNHPAFGGSHLPDVTVITPVFAADGTLLGHVASRAHHAEIGGIRPGSMPPAATCLAEEGVVLPPLHLVRRGQAQWHDLRARLEAEPYPTRSVEDNLADVRAAVAANHAGANALRELAREHGAATVARYMGALRGLAAERLSHALSLVPEGRYAATESLDDGTPLAVTIDVARGRARVDFSGSGPVHRGNLNATPAIVQSVVIYVMRLLLREPLPLNEGLLDVVSIHIPPGLLDPPFGDDPRLAPAVVGGNVETSQRLVDTLLRALGLAACSQGTMNNVIFGNAHSGYYETLGGGAGAGPGFPGASGVHTHMTNTRITDPEVLERRHPVRVERFAVRRGSGGAGRHRGGDGLVREIRFLEPMSLSVLTQHRVVAPYGLDGGGPGACGSQRIVRQTGEIVALGPSDGCELGAGDRLVVETPGGGGHGTP